jgi:tetratricopeptide (TPR) repeat protein
MQQADAVQTSTPRLAERWRPWARQVAVFANHLAEVPPLAPPPQRPLTIGWAGSPGHFADWYQIAAPLSEWLADHASVHLAVMTNEFARPFVRVAPDRYRFTPFGSYADYLRFLPSLDIGLAPLLPTPYNRGRSDVKFVEYAAHGVAGVYARFGPYIETVSHEKTGLLYQNVGELFHHLTRLAEDPSLRESIRRQAYDYVASHRRIEQHIHARLDLYRGLLPQAPTPIDFPEDLASLAARDGRYMQFRPGPIERTLMDSLQSRANPESVQRLEQIADAHPNYHSAQLECGCRLNDLREPKRAYERLEIGYRHAPWSAAILAEMGRAFFVAGNHARARELLEQALKVNPWLLPGWRYLLRQLAQTQATDGEEWARRARGTFPLNFELALLGLPLYPTAKRCAELERLLDLYGPTIKFEEYTTAALAFGRAIQMYLKANPDEPRNLAMLRKACEYFPESVRILDMFGHALLARGREEEARRWFRRALQFHHAAALYHSEFPKTDGSIHFWQFAFHIDAVTNGGREAKD